MKYLSLKIAALCASYNRAQITFSSITSLLDEVKRSLYDVHLEIFLVDDQSTDETVLMLSRIPNVNIISTRGDFYWSKSMLFGYKYIADTGFNPDLILAFNDDTNFFSGFLDHLLDIWLGNHTETIVVGKIVDRISRRVIYGGRLSASIFLPKSSVLCPDESICLQVDTFNMNCVLIPFPISQRLGFLNPAYSHALADWDYGYYCSRKGINLVQASIPVGSAELNSSMGTSSEKGISLLRRLRRILSIKEQPIMQRFHYSLSSHSYAFIQTLLSPYLVALVKHVTRRY